MVRFGVEEEFIVLDRASLAPVPRGAEARRALRAASAAAASEDPAKSTEISAEFLDCQVEVATSPVEDLLAARAELTDFRDGLCAFGRESEVVVASAGTPYACAQRSVVTAKERYRAIADLMGDLTREHFVNGLHVHTEVQDPEDRVRALNAVRPWLPVLLALSANSPFWRERHSGFASWRSILLRRLPTMWCPPVFHDASDYQQRIDRLVRMDAAVDRASIAWAARISSHLDTVEVRVFDAQLTVDDTLLAAALTRAVVTERPVTMPMDSEAIDASLWTAAKEGMAAQLVDPFTGEVASAWSVADLLIEAVSGTLVARADKAFVDDQVGVVRARGTGSDRQRAAHAEGGVGGLRALLAEC